MSTRSRIAIDNGNGTITSIYCHNDGYPHWVGAILAKYYTPKDDSSEEALRINNNKLKELMANGDLSYLGPNTTGGRKNNGSLSYKEWRNEDAPAITESYRDFKRGMFDADEEYVYLYRKADRAKYEWVVYSYYPEPLAKAIREDEEWREQKKGLRKLQQKY